MWKKEFDTSYVGFMKDGAQWLVDNTDIKLVGEFQLTVNPLKRSSVYLMTNLYFVLYIYIKLMCMLIVLI
jgi:hypothetical protein